MNKLILAITATATLFFWFLLISRTPEISEGVKAFTSYPTSSSPTSFASDSYIGPTVNTSFR